MSSRIFLILTSLFLLSFNAHGEVDNRLKYDKKNSSNISDALFNVRLTEFHWAVYNELNLEAFIRLGSHMAIGPTIGYMNNAEGIHKDGEILEVFDANDTTSRLQYGLKAMFTINHINASGVYFTGFARRQESTIKRDPDTGSLFGSSYFASEGKFTGMVYGATAGYQWQVGIMRLAIGGGYQMFDSPDNIQLKRTDGQGSDIATISSLGRAGSVIIDGGIGLTF